MNILYAKSFQKQFKKSGKKIQSICMERIQLFAQNQDAQILHRHELLGRKRGLSSINITGDWRALYKVIGDDVVFVELGTHSQLYK